MTEKEEELKRIHFAYCDKANIDVNADDAKKFLQERCDAAIDCVDKCMIYIEEQQFNKGEDEKNATEAISQRENEEQKRIQIQGCLAQVASNKRFANEISAKMQTIIDSKRYTMDNMVLVKTYNDRIQDIFENLNQAWNGLILQNGDEENLVKDSEINSSRVAIQDAIGMGLVFIEKCAGDEADKLKSRTIAHVPSEESRHFENRGLKTEKLKFPTFSGNIRTFAKFQKDFRRIVEPSYAGDQLSYVLKESCLRGPAKNAVENIDEVEEIWKRLQDKYGDKLDLVEVVIKELDAVPTLKGNDDHKFIGMVDLLEKGLQDLDAIGARGEIANAYTVKMLESKLSRNLYMNWLKEEEKIEGDSRFVKMFSFLKSERKRVEKLVQRGEPVRSKDPIEEKNKKGERSAHASHDNDRPKATRDNCLIHSKVPHFTRKCRAFLAKSPRERAEIVKATKGCPLCLSISHVDKPCPWTSKWEPCKVDNCEQYHSHLLHEAAIQGLMNMHVTYEENVNSTEKLGNHSLLLMQQIQTEKGPIHAFFDNGSTITLVSKSYIKRHKMKGIKISYDLVTVGGHVHTQDTYLHDITLVDSWGSRHVVQAYEIPDICGQMKSVDVSGVVQLFQDLTVEEVNRMSGSVELLIGIQ